MEQSQFHTVFLNSSYRFTEKSRLFSDTEIKTHFEDWEAISLCAGITNYSKARQVWQKWQKGIDLTEDNFKLAHKIANDLRDNHGDEILNLLISCPPKPFQLDESIELFTQLDVSKDKIKNPAIRFLAPKNEKFVKAFYKTFGVDTPEYVIQNDLKSGEYFKPNQYKFQISFWVEKRENKVINRNTNLIVFRNVTTGQNLAHITRAGQFIPLENAYIPKPVISLFFNVCKDTKTYIINYGLDSGNCSYCDRELSNPRSIKNNYGKTCAKNNSLPW